MVKGIINDIMSAHGGRGLIKGGFVVMRITSRVHRKTGRVVTVSGVNTKVNRCILIMRKDTTEVKDNVPRTPVSTTVIKVVSRKLKLR